MYETGHGSVRARATWEKEGTNLVITAMPHQASPGKVIEQIAVQMRAKKLPWLEDIRRVRPQQPDPHRADPAQQPGPRRPADGEPVRDHGSREELDRKSVV